MHVKLRSIWRVRRGDYVNEECFANLCWTFHSSQMEITWSPNFPFVLALTNHFLCALSRINDLKWVCKERRETAQHWRSNINGHHDGTADHCQILWCSIKGCIKDAAVSAAQTKAFEELAQYLEPQYVMPLRATVTKNIGKTLRRN